MKYFLLEKNTMNCECHFENCNCGHNGLELFDILTIFSFAASEKKRDC